MAQISQKKAGTSIPAAFRMSWSSFNKQFLVIAANPLPLLLRTSRLYRLTSFGVTTRE